MHDEGVGAKQDFSLAMHWYHLAAERGEAKAMFNLGVLYDEGLGLEEPDFTRAAHWYRAGRGGRRRARGVQPRKPLRGR